MLLPVAKSWSERVSKNLCGHPGECEKKRSPALVMAKEMCRTSCRTFALLLKDKLTLTWFLILWNTSSKESQTWRARHSYWGLLNPSLVLTTTMNYVCAWEKIWFYLSYAPVPEASCSTEPIQRGLLLKYV